MMNKPITAPITAWAVEYCEKGKWHIGGCGHDSKGRPTTCSIYSDKIDAESECKRRNSSFDRLLPAIPEKWRVRKVIIK